MDDLTPDQLKLQTRAAEVAAEFRDEVAGWDAADRAPYAEVAARMRDAGLMGLTMPKEAGGQDLTAFEYLIVVEALFRHGQHWILAEPTFATSGPGPSIIMMSPSHVVRERFLPDLVTGVRQCAIALTEPGYGSDLTSLETVAIPEGDGFRLRGAKNFVTGATENDLYAVFVRFDDIPGAAGIGAVVLEAETDGLTVERGPEFMGLRGIPHGDLTIDDVYVPPENVVVGAGDFARLMTAFNMERLHNTAFQLGMAQAAWDAAAGYVESRHAFGRPILEFQTVYHALTDLHIEIEAARLLAYRAGRTAIDGKFPRFAEVTMAKLFASTVAPKVTLKALELYGGYGVTTRYGVERIHRDVVTGIVAGGSPPVLRNGIATQLFPNQRFRQTR